MRLVRNIRLAWHERVHAPLLGLRRCTHLTALLDERALAGRPVQHDLEHIVRVTTRRELSRFVLGDHPDRQSLSDLFDRGAVQATRVLTHLQSTDTVLEYGGGIGRMGRAITSHVRRLVSVDGDPLMKVYGERISPGIEFFNRDDLPATEEFDGAYAIDGFLHLSLAQKKEALDYIHRRLKPGGWLLVDVRPGDDLRAIYEPLFSAKRIPLFNAGFLLRKSASSPDAASPVSADGRYCVNEASVVADVLEGEVVIVNLDNGSYYILQGTASGVWQMLSAGRSVPDIIVTLCRYHADAAQLITSSVNEFIAQLIDEALLLPASGGDQAVTSVDEATLARAGHPFEAPVMFRYTDMQALIQMDPIREYDETGWPTLRGAQGTATRKQ